VEIVLIIVSAVAGALVKWLFDHLATVRSDRARQLEAVMHARHQAMEAAEAANVAMSGGSAASREAAMVAVSQAANRLMALRDLQTATRLVQWLTAMALELTDKQITAEKTAFLLHINDPL
jgi:hypothetical protein